MTKRSKTQFRTSTLLLYTLVIAFALAVLIRTDFAKPSNTMAIASFFLVPLLALPALMERALDAKLPLRFGPLMGAFQIFAVSVYSSLTYLLSIVAFIPSWKGSKGLNWIFYINDGLPAMVVYPFYVGGALAFAYAVFKPTAAAKSPFVPAAIAINAAVSWLYVFSVVVLRFTSSNLDSQRLFAMIPLAAALAYSMMAIALWRRRDFNSAKESWGWMFAWCGGFLLAMFAKVPLAMRLYAALPDEPPQECFIVTAASRGHPLIVRSRYDEDLRRTVNQQLTRFWRLEALLADCSPRFHQSLRRVYNRLGPLVAGMIVMRWQADLIYLSLKPLEWLAVVALLRFQCRSHDI